MQWNTNFFFLKEQLTKRNTKESQVLYDITYIWNQKKCNKLVNIAKRNKLTNADNKLEVTSVGERNIRGILCVR